VGEAGRQDEERDKNGADKRVHPPFLPSVPGRRCSTSQ
jgi:hypothetical protein